jgi:hypothetical protein
LLLKSSYNQLFLCRQNIKETAKGISNSVRVDKLASFWK